jgi:hypothetical protein
MKGRNGHKACAPDTSMGTDCVVDEDVNEEVILKEIKTKLSRFDLDLTA